MKKTIISELNDIFEEYLRNKSIEKVKFIVGKTKNNAWGDFSTNIALVLAKSLKKTPKDLAKSSSKYVNSAKIKKKEVTNPGFINVFFFCNYYKNFI